MKQDEAKLRLLGNLPVGVEGDEFEHGLYADMLAAIFRSGKPGRCVGFFGKWGQGKSSVVQQMEEKLEGINKVITFNAWKASGDSIRRQLLLRVLREIVSSDELEKLQAASGVIVPDSMLEDAEKRAKKSRGLWKTVLDWRVVLALVLVPPALALFSYGVCLVAAALKQGTFATQFLQIAQGTLFPSSIALALFVVGVIKRRYSVHLSVDELGPDSKRLKLPEQFQKIFIREVSKYCHDHADLIVVIDDLDRCDAQTVAQALAAIRQFTPDTLRRAGAKKEGFRCQFLVPCDEQQVVLALETAGHDAGKHGARTHDYESKELLRKFFDVTLRMHDINQDDFLDYASTLTEDINLDPHEAMEIVALVQPDDPRLVKQLLNALCLSHDRLARQRELEALPPELPNLENTERLLVALRETIPSVYAWIAADPSILQEENHLAWKRMSEKTEDEETQAAVGWNEPSVVASRREVDRAKKMLTNAGRVSAATAEILVHSKLPKLLHGAVGAGSLILSIRHADQKRFDEVLSNLDDTKRPAVQLWLAREARRISERAATGLRQLLTLFLSHPHTHDANDFITPCLQAALTPTRNLREALSDHPELDKLAAFLPILESRISDQIITALVEDFLSTDGKSDPELRFLLATCKEMPAIPQAYFREWLVEGLKDRKEASEFLERISGLLPENRSVCNGFAPEGAVAAAHRAQWEALDGETKHPRQDVIITLLGDSPAHAAQCLDAILDGEGQLASPRAITGTNKAVEAAWATVGELLALVEDAAVQKQFQRIQFWLNQGIDNGTRKILDALGRNAFQLADPQLNQLARYISGWLISQPRETWLLEFVGPVPVDESLVSGWTFLASNVFEKYAHLLRDPTDLPQHAKPVIKRVGEFEWPVARSAESLLVRKLEASSQMRQFKPWLDALAPLVRAGSDFAAIRTKILEHTNRKSEKASMAITAGLAVLWAKEIDDELATSVGELFVSKQSSLSQSGGDSWDTLREKKGAGKVLDTMASGLPEEISSLKSFENVLNMLAMGVDLPEAEYRRHFLDKTVFALVSSADQAARKLGITLAGQSAKTTGALRKQLSILIKEGNLSSEEEQTAKAAKEKPLLRIS